ncbi:MAG: hypothetical protein ACFB16_00210 [Phormidesmis sp.]
MPPRWPREPDPANDPPLRRLEDRINFAVHVAGFACVNSGIWLVYTINPGSLPQAKLVTFTMLGILFAHAVYVFAIADYTPKKVDVGK